MAPTRHPIDQQTASAKAWGSAVVPSSYCGHPGLVYEPRPRSVLELLTFAFRWSGRTFIVQGSRRIGFDDFLNAIDIAASRLRGLGVGPGSRVLLLAYNSPEFVLATWSTWRLGAVPVMGNRWWSDAEINHALALTEPDLLLTDSPLAPEHTSVASLAIGKLGAAYDQAQAHIRATALPAVSTAEDSPALIIFTSGSTGTPKAVLLSHRSIVANQHNLLLRSSRLPHQLDIDASQPVTLVSAPLFHVGGVSSFVTQLLVGGRLVLNEGRFDPSQILSLIETERVQNWGAVPTMARRVLEHPAFDAHDLSSLRSFPLGGAPVPPNLIRRMRSKLPQLAHRGVTNTWGMTESGGFVTIASSADLEGRPDTVGRPYPVTELRILHPDTTGVGEILVRSPTVTLGYLGTDDGTVDEEGWLHTGDLGHIDADGYLFLDGRVKDVVIRGGENIATAHVERTLLEHPCVAEAAAFGIPHDDLGEELAVVVVRTDETVREETLRDFLRSRLAYFEIPTRWQIQTTALPTLAGEKVDKRRLAAEMESAS